MSEEPGLGAYVARNVRARRAYLGRSQTQVADAAGWSAQTLSELEQGRRKVTVDDLPKLCAALECNLAELTRNAPAEFVTGLGLLPPSGE